MAHTVLARLENGYWRMYVDDLREPGYAVSVADTYIVKMEVRRKARELSPCEAIMIGYGGIEELHEVV